MKYLILFISSVVLFISCSRPSNSNAENICECFKEATRGGNLMETKIDSCKQMYKKVLTDLEGNEESRKEFAAAFDYCRNN